MEESGTMRLAGFIRANLEPILLEFEDFARTHTRVGVAMDIRALRDHAAAMLADIVVDMDEHQSESEQQIKSKGDAPDAQTPDTAAERHGTDRAKSGFSLEEMFSEYRALRASVLRLWTEARGELDETDMLDLTRFNEAIDQALAESIVSFSLGIDRSREMFLAILGHDLRTPLGAVVTASSFLVTNGGLTDRNLRLAERIHASGTRMNELVGDLLDFTSSRLGKGIPVVPADTDVAAVAREAVEEIQAMHPTRELRFETNGDVRGEWDASRVSQALSNLIGNAVQHGAEGAPVAVMARGSTDDVVISVHNLGRVLTTEDQRDIFDPFERGEAAGSGDLQGKTSVGLGLYIAHQIALAHGGSIEVSSSAESGTTFELHLPRQTPT